MKYEDEGQVRSQHLLFDCAVFSLSFQAVVLLNENCNKSSFFFSIKSEMSGWIWEIPTIWVKELLLYNRNGTEAFFENFHQKWKNASRGAQFRYFQIK